MAESDIPQGARTETGPPKDIVTKEKVQRRVEAYFGDYDFNNPLGHQEQRGGFTIITQLGRSYDKSDTYPTQDDGYHYYDDLRQRKVHRVIRDDGFEVASITEGSDADRNKGEPKGLIKRYELLGGSHGEAFLAYATYTDEWGAIREVLDYTDGTKVQTETGEPYYKTKHTMFADERATIEPAIAEMFGIAEDVS